MSTPRADPIEVTFAHRRAIAPDELACSRKKGNAGGIAKVFKHFCTATRMGSRTLSPWLMRLDCVARRQERPTEYAGSKPRGDARHHANSMQKEPLSDIAVVECPSGRCSTSYRRRACCRRRESPAVDEGSGGRR
jgi:hypothetical protein